MAYEPEPCDGQPLLPAAGEDGNGPATADGEDHYEVPNDGLRGQGFGEDADTKHPPHAPARRQHSAHRLSTLYPDAKEGVPFQDLSGLAKDLCSLLRPEFHDCYFVVGPERVRIGGVRCVIAARSHVLKRLLYPSKGVAGDTTSPTPTKKGSTRSSKRSSRAALVKPDEGMEIEVQEFDVTTMKLLVQYLLTGGCTLQADTLLGLLNAADHFSLDALRNACADFGHQCVAIDTVVPLLIKAGEYIQYKSTKILMRIIFEFIDDRADEVMSLPEFEQLPPDVVRLVIAREELTTSEIAKFECALRWGQAYVLRTPGTTLNDVMQPLVCFISFHEISTSALMKIVKPAGCVSDETLMFALAYQADPSSVEPGDIKPRPRCDTLHDIRNVLPKKRGSQA